MDNWKIQLIVVTFCALLQTYQGLMTGVEEERGLYSDWQVSFNLKITLNPVKFFVD